MNITNKQKAILSTYYPELIGLVEKQSNPVTDALVIALISKIEFVKGEKGDAGYSPVKGQDYFTEEEISLLINLILKEATPIKGVHYIDGEKGDSYVLTSKDKKEIANSIEVPIVEKIIERVEVIKEIKQEIDFDEVIKPLEKKLLDGMAKFDGRIKLIDQRWHGGGISKVSHDTTLSGDGTPSNPLHAIGTGGFSTDIPSETPNSIITVFTFPTVSVQPSFVVVDYAMKPATAKNGYVNWTWNGLLKQVTLSTPAQEDIFSIK